MLDLTTFMLNIWTVTCLRIKYNIWRFSSHKICGEKQKEVKKMPQHILIIILNWCNKMLHFHYCSCYSCGTHHTHNVTSKVLKMNQFYFDCEIKKKLKQKNKWVSGACSVSLCFICKLVYLCVMSIYHFNQISIRIYVFLNHKRHESQHSGTYIIDGLEWINHKWHSSQSIR